MNRPRGVSVARSCSSLLLPLLLSSLAGLSPVFCCSVQAFVGRKRPFNTVKTIHLHEQHNICQNASVRLQGCTPAPQTILRSTYVQQLR